MQFGDYSLNDTKTIKSDVKQLKRDVNCLYWLIIIFCALTIWSAYMDNQIRVKLAEILKKVGNELQCVKNHTQPLMSASNIQ